MLSRRSPRLNVTPRSPLPKREYRSGMNGGQMGRGRSKGGVFGYIFNSVLLITLFGLCLSGMYLLYMNFPTLPPEHSRKIKLPRSLDDAKDLATVLSIYKSEYYYEVMSSFFATYIFLQTFAIPGSIFLSVLSGTLFSFHIALFLVCLCSAIGASNCFLLSYLFGMGIVEKYFPDRLRQWRHSLNKHRDNTFLYMLFLRITPFLPNWFINIAAPVLHVSIVPFFFGTFFGVCPPSFLFIQMGTTLYEMKEFSGLPKQSLFLLTLFGFVFLLPIVFKSKLSSKLN